MMNSTNSMGDGIGWGMGFGGFSMVIFWGLILFGIVVIVRWLGGGSGNMGLPKQKDALDILKERYARGEINQQEFQAKRRELEQ